MKKRFLFPLILLIIVMILFCYLLIKNYIGYKTWGNNEMSYFNTEEGFEVECDYFPFDVPSNCRLVPILIEP